MLESASISGDGLLALAQDLGGQTINTTIHKDDGYSFEPWVVVLQAINHATEHREQIKSMMSALGIKPPRVDGWQYGRATGALVPPK